MSSFPLSAIETRVDNIETRLDNIETRLDNIEATTTENTAAIAENTAAIADLKEEMHRMETRMETKMKKEMLEMEARLRANMFSDMKNLLDLYMNQGKLPSSQFSSSTTDTRVAEPLESPSSASIPKIITTPVTSPAMPPPRIVTALKTPPKPPASTLNLEPPSPSASVSHLSPDTQFSSIRKRLSKERMKEVGAQVVDKISAPFKKSSSRERLQQQEQAQGDDGQVSPAQASPKLPFLDQPIDPKRR